MTMTEHEERREGGGEERDDKGEVCAAMLGSLGLFGNGLIQLVASIALAESQGLALTVPKRWHDRFGRLFEGGGADADAANADADAKPTTTPRSRYRWRPIPDAEAWALPIVSDRVVLSHAGFRAWMATREPYLSLAAAAAAAAGGGNANDANAANAAALSGRQLRRLFPQATVADLLGGGGPGGGTGEGATPTPPPARLAGRGLWGWFQWPTAALAPRAPLLLGAPRAPLRLRPELARALDAAVDALAACYASGMGGAKKKGRRRTTKLVAVHLRRGDCAGTVCPEKGHATTTATTATTTATTTGAAGGGGGGDGSEATAPSPPPPTPSLLRTEPPFEVRTGEAWDDQGLCWRTPLEWLGPGLERALVEVVAARGKEGGDEEEGEEEEEQQGGDADADADADDRPPPPLVVLCTDDPHLARDPSAVWPGAATWAAAAAAEAGAAAEAAEDRAVLAAAVAAARAALERARLGGEGGDADLGMLLDWRLMQRADALLVSNSTFSFTAAWLSAEPTPTRLCFRPCPQARRFVCFDPWDSLPLLPSRANLPANHGALRKRQEEQQQQAAAEGGGR